MQDPIADDELLYRRIHHTWITWEDGRPRPSSEAFKDRRENRLSVVIARETTVRRLLRGRPEDSVVSFIAKAARDLQLRVERDFDPELPGHALLIPAPKGSKARRLAERALWVKLRDPRSTTFKLRRWIRNVPAKIRSLFSHQN